MKVLITGGTGFVGSHTAAELIRNGHEIRLLVRSPERIKRALGPLGISEVDAVQGDVLDRSSVEAAANGCDATIHCGSVYSLDPRAAANIKRTNVTGTEIVLDAAQKMGHDPIIHVSSFVALIGEKHAVLTPDSKPTRPSGTYFRSKADSDSVARRFQAKGIPVVITYPGSVWGPNDPHFGESCQIVRNALKGYWRITPKGLLPISDVRDIAALHSAILKKGRGPRRYMAPIQNVSISQVFEIISKVTGQNVRTSSIPGWTLLWPLRFLDMVQKPLPFRFPVNYQAAYCADLASRMDDSATRSEFGIIPRPLFETIGDTLRWIASEGYLSTL